ncbi:MAG: hypothetical protein ABW277_01095 [Longimicrobiaceae bacterium]
MALVISGREISRVSIVDDDDEARQGYQYSIEDLNLTPVSETGPINSLTEFLAIAQERSDAAICDHHLRKRNYAQFNGAEIVAALYRRGFPALLCTKYETAEVEEIRKHMRWVPVMMKPDQLDPSSMEEGFMRCIDEFRGDFQPSRRPWRTLLRVDDVVSDGRRRWFGVIIPAWDSNQVVRVWFDQVPEQIQGIVKPDIRLHAQVNLGAETSAELYFTDWEER